MTRLLLGELDSTHALKPNIYERICAFVSSPVCRLTMPGRHPWPILVSTRLASDASVIGNYSKKTPAAWSFNFSTLVVAGLTYPTSYESRHSQWIQNSHFVLLQFSAHGVRLDKMVHRARRDPLIPVCFRLARQANDAGWAYIHPWRGRTRT
jgi:hypothetical protein